MNYTNINVLTLKTIRDTIQTHLTNLVKRRDLELEQRVQIEGDKEDQKTCWEEISSLMWDIILASDATDLWTTEMLTTINRIWAIPAAPNFLTYKLAYSFVFTTMDVSVLCLSVEDFSVIRLRSGPSSSCEMIILRKKSHGEIIGVFNRNINNRS